MNSDDEKFHQQKLDELISIIDQIELYKSKNPETDLHERKEIERRILLCPEYKDFINKYFEFLKSVQDEEDNEQESEDKLLHLMRMKTKISNDYSIKPVLKQKEYINHIKTDI